MPKQLPETAESGSECQRERGVPFGQDASTRSAWQNWSGAACFLQSVENFIHVLSEEDEKLGPIRLTNDWVSGPLGCDFQFVYCGFSLAMMQNCFAAWRSAFNNLFGGCCS